MTRSVDAGWLLAWWLIFIDLGVFWDLEACSLEAWGQNARQPVSTCGGLWRPVGTDWMPSNKPLLDASWLLLGWLAGEGARMLGNLWRAVAGCGARLDAL